MIGVADDGSPIGMQDTDATYNRITNSVRDAIAPDVTMFVQPTLLDNDVIQLDVSEGSNKPYYIREKGPTPGGVYVRQGASKAQASPGQIRNMIKESDGYVFETMRAPIQNLTFRSAASAFHEAGLELTSEKFPGLGLVRTDTGLFTNAALLLSDQCLHTTKVAVLEEGGLLNFRNAREFDGSLFTQLQNALDLSCSITKYMQKYTDSKGTRCLTILSMPSAKHLLTHSFIGNTASAAAS